LCHSSHAACRNKPQSSAWRCLQMVILTAIVFSLLLIEIAFTFIATACFLVKGEQHWIFKMLWALYVIIISFLMLWYVNHNVGFMSLSLLAVAGLFFSIRNLLPSPPTGPESPGSVHS
jgi:hypothetical protein